MDSQNTSFSQSPSAIDPDEARRRFLASMGIGDPEPEMSSEMAPAIPKPEKNEDGVALSSSPEDLELAGVSKSTQARSRVISYDVRPKTVAKASQPGTEQLQTALMSSESESDSKLPQSQKTNEVSAPLSRAEEEFEDEVANETSPSAVDATSAKAPEAMSESPADSKEPLQLSCPKCKGDLVLMQEHVGIEGACVWCETKIVAARSGTDGEVRVFPLFQPDSLKPPVETVSEPLSGSTAAETVSGAPREIGDMVSKEHLDPSPAIPEGVEDRIDSVPQKEMPAPQAVPESEFAPADWSGGFDTPSTLSSGETDEASDSTPAEGFGDPFPAPENAPVEKIEPAQSVPSGFSECSPSSSSDSASPSAVDDSFGELPSGFGEPAEFPATNSPADGTSDLDEAPISAGFSDEFSADPFQSAMPANEETKDEVAGTEAPAEFSEGWGKAPASDEVPAGFGESPFSDNASIEFEDHDSKLTTDDGSEAEEPAGFSDAASWGPPAGNGSNDLSPAPIDPEERDSAPKSLEEPVAFQSGFEAVSAKGNEPVAEAEGPVWGSSDETPALSAGTSEFAASPSKPLAQAPTEESPPAPISESSSEFGSGFEIPSSEENGFPSGASSSEEVDSIFSDAAGTDESVSEEIASWGSQSEAVPASKEPSVEADVKAADSDAPSVAAAKPQLFAASSSNDAGGSVFGNQSTATTGPPPIPNAASSAEETGKGLFGGSPTVTSQPLGSKPAKKKSKGMVVFLVILFGLVCGAALASFVLPVDEYVGKARAFMEQKLNMDSGVDPALFLSELVAPDNGQTQPALPSGLEAAVATAGTQEPESVPTPMPAPVSAEPETDQAPVSQ